MSADYIRRCPTCGADNAQNVMRCACGALLAGVDLVLKQAAAEIASAATSENALPPKAETPAAAVICPFRGLRAAEPAGQRELRVLRPPAERRSGADSAGRDAQPAEPAVEAG